MNSEEIKEYLKYKKYLLTLSEYLKIIENPQIRKVENIKDKLYLETDDGYTFIFKIK